MDDIHQHDQSQSMGLINHRLELIRRSAATAGGKEIGHVVSEAPVIGMLLNGHDLDGIVTEFANSGQHLFSELEIAVHFGLLTRHPHVTLVDA